MRHVIVTRFSVPRLNPATAGRHRDRKWLDGRMGLFRKFFVPSVGRTGVPVILLCSSESASRVQEETRDLPWVRVEIQDEWYGGWSGEEDQMVTRLDSDDALHEGWFRALEAAPPHAGVYCTKRFYRFDVEHRRLYRYSRRELSPLAAFRGGGNPYASDHQDLHRHHRLHLIRPPYLLQIVHGGNVSSRAPGWWRFYRRRPLSRLAPFGFAPKALE